MWIVFYRTTTILYLQLFILLRAVTLTHNYQNVYGNYEIQYSIFADFTILTVISILAKLQLKQRIQRQLCPLSYEYIIWKSNYFHQNSVGGDGV